MVTSIAVVTLYREVQILHDEIMAYHAKATAAIALKDVERAQDCIDIGKALIDRRENLKKGILLLIKARRLA